MAIEQSPPGYDPEKSLAHSGTYKSEDPETGAIVDAPQNGQLKRGLHGRHMQMIAVGGAIGAGLFVGSGGALHKGGPGSLVGDSRIKTY